MIGAAIAIGETRWNVGGPRQRQCRRGAGRRLCFDALERSLSLRRGRGRLARAETDRTLNIAGTDRLEADFDATSFGARIEGGRRFGSDELA